MCYLGAARKLKVVANGYREFLVFDSDDFDRQLHDRVAFVISTAK